MDTIADRHQLPKGVQTFWKDVLHIGLGKEGWSVEVGPMNRNTEDLIRGLKAQGRLPRLWEGRSKEGTTIWKAMRQPSWLVGTTAKCKSLISIWYEDTTWATGEWGIKPDSTTIFDTDWSIWTPEDKMLITFI